MTLPVFITVIADHDKPQPSGCLLGLSEEAPKSRKKTLPKAPPKYQFEENGETKYWSGRGRAPKPIDEALKAGRSLEDFRINKSLNGVTDEQ
uniref:Putative DNA-binding protein n=1 Tax=Escherichia coli TaxID=562 RepID=F4MJ30_ECOLX|nr:putative DNA-binding protein [Escherichia coli]